MTHIGGFNSLRFCAVFAVVTAHIEQEKSYLRVSNWYGSGIASQWGGAGVNLFFVLSGFLITLLLLEERSVHGTISVKDFYIRRALRILPPYFLMIAIGFIVAPHLISENRTPISSLVRLQMSGFMAHYRTSLAFHLMMLPNIASIWWASPLFCPQLWSIGVEEQFYWIWPWIVRRTTSVGMFRTICMTVIAINLLVQMSAAVIPYFWPNRCIPLLQVLRDYRAIDMVGLVIGALAAQAVVHDRERFLRLFKLSWLRWWFPITIGLLWTARSSWNLLWLFLYATILLAMYIDQEGSNRYWRVTEYLGKISYGLYMYHYLAIFSAIAMIQHVRHWQTIEFFYANPVFANVALYNMTFAFTILFTVLSFYFLEQPFLRLRKRYGSLSRM